MRVPLADSEDMKTFVVGVVLVAVVVASGCSRGGELASGDPVAGVDLVPGPVGSFDVITHGDDGPFWSVFQQGVAQAGIDLGTTVRYQGAAGDLVAQAEMVLAAVEQGSGGVAMSVPDPAALEEAAGAVTTARLPFYVVNVGEDEADDLGAVTYIGPSDYETGQAAGARFDGLGATSVLCARQDENVDFDQRCQGLEASFSGIQPSRNGSCRRSWVPTRRSTRCSVRMPASRRGPSSPPGRRTPT
jgi:simple sugar transport system substrate-binding protein